MYDTGMPEGHNTNGVYTGFDNISELPRCGYSTPDKSIEFPGLTLAEYKEKGLLQKGCENLKRKRRYISTERILFLSHSI